MARFWGQVSGKARTDASRLGSDQVRTKCNAWSIGASCSAYETGAERTPSGKYATRDGKKLEGRDVVSVGITGGSHNGTVLLDLGTWERDGDGLCPADDVARRIFRCLSQSGKVGAR
jgi:hypothetical protein